MRMPLPLHPYHSGYNRSFGFFRLDEQNISPGLVCISLIARRLDIMA